MVGTCFSRIAWWQDARLGANDWMVRRRNTVNGNNDLPFSARIESLLVQFFKLEAVGSGTVHDGIYRE